MKTCKTCNYWTVAPDATPYQVDRICDPVDPDTCESMVLPFEVRICMHPSKTFAERPVERNGFGLVDGSDFFAALATAEDFGCVRHEEPRS